MLALSLAVKENNVTSKTLPATFFSDNKTHGLAFWTSSGVIWGLHSAAHGCYIRIETRARRHEKEMCASIHLSFKMEALKSAIEGSFYALTPFAHLQNGDYPPPRLPPQFKLRLSAQNCRGQTPVREFLRTVWGLIRPFRHLLS